MPDATLDGGPVVRRVGECRVVVVLRASADAPPVAIATRARDGVVDAVFQPTVRKRRRRATVPWHYVLRLPAPVPMDAPLTVRIVGLGFDADVEVAVPPQLDADVSSDRPQRSSSTRGG